MNETVVTVTGYVGTAPEERTVLDTVAASFRVASTPRRYNKLRNAWEDLETSWYTVNVWRSLASHCMRSLHVGEPVIVHGRLRASQFEAADGSKRTSMVIEAYSVGHDLNRGTSAFLKAQSAAGDSALAELNARLDDEEMPQMTSDGRFVDPPAVEAPAASGPDAGAEVATAEPAA